MLSIDEARSLLATRVTPLAAVECPLAEAAGQRLARAVHADADLPPADLSAMDGYATRHDDLLHGGALPVALELPAGAMPEPLARGNAARIFTGAPLPAGADTVVQQEKAKRDARGRVLLEALPSGSNVRRRGELFARGHLLASAGAVLTPARVALLAAGGASKVRVVPRPQLACLITGHELIETDVRPGPGQIRNSNGPMLAALAESQDLIQRLSLRVDDDEASTRAAIEGAVKKAELVLSSGGVSVGDYDFVPRVIAELGGEVIFHGVSLKPGKPTLVARVNETYFVGLPGNPLAVLVGWRLFVQPLVEALAGDGSAFEESLPTAAIAEPYHNRSRRTVLHPALVTPSVKGAIVYALPWKGSHDLVAGAQANALLRVEPRQSFAAGDLAPCYLL